MARASYPQAKKLKRELTSKKVNDILSGMKIKRKIYNQIYKHMSEKEITMLIGPRQSGKTTIMKQVQKDLLKEKMETVYLNLDIDKDIEVLESQEKLLQFLKLHIKNTGYVFIDEFQKKKNAGVFLKGLYDMDLPYKFIISGSGSIELKEKTYESLAGRKRIFTIYPVSFEEFALYKCDYKYDTLKEIHNIEPEKEKLLFNEYMSYGGYPKVVITEDKNEKYAIINEIVQSFLHKDVLTLIKYEKLDDFQKLIKILGTYNGSMLEYTNLSNATGLSPKTIKNYIRYLEETHIIKRITPFSKKRIGEITKMPTLYFIDIGFLHYSLGSFGSLQSEKEGLLFQNIIWRMLEELFENKGASINYWRTKTHQEVDFVIDYQNTLSACEIKYSSKKISTSSLYSFQRKYPKSNLYIINKGGNTVEKEAVRVVPYYELEVFNL